MESPVTFIVSASQPVGMWHAPRGTPSRAPAVVFLHGFTGSKHEAHRLFVIAARRLADAGIGVLRFDFRGSGDSHGDFRDMTLAAEIEDAQAALAWIRARPEVDAARVGLLGMSMGGLVAAEVMSVDAQIKAAVLWCPVGDPAALLSARMTASQAQALGASGVMDYGGWPVGRAFVEDLRRRNPVASFSATRQPVLMLHGDADETVPLSDSHRYLDARNREQVETVLQVICGADHVFSSLAWTDDVTDRSVRWFHRHLVPDPVR